MGNQIDRYSKYTARFFENFEKNLENIACADTIEEFNIAVGCYHNQNTMGNQFRKDNTLGRDAFNQQATLINQKTIVDWDWGREISKMNNLKIYWL